MSDYSSVISAVATFGLVAFSVFQWISLKARVKESAKSRYASLILSVEEIMQKLVPDLLSIHSLEATRHASWELDERRAADHVVG
ncbi:MAG: hypothetical protein H3C64_10895 [Candidatus Kuenenia stuttgartiensis]|nr:hypothetical protein [Candidatus Kuenenia stuttgartiensis]